MTTSATHMTTHTQTFATTSPMISTYIFTVRFDVELASFNITKTNRGFCQVLGVNTSICLDSYFANVKTYSGSTYYVFQLAGPLIPYQSKLQNLLANSPTSVSQAVGYPILATQSTEPVSSKKVLGMSTGAAAGMIVAIILAVLIAIAVVAFILIRRRREDSSYSRQDSSLSLTNSTPSSSFYQVSQPGGGSNPMYNSDDGGIPMVVYPAHENHDAPIAYRPAPLAIPKASSQPVSDEGGIPMVVYPAHENHDAPITHRPVPLAIPRTSATPQSPIIAAPSTSRSQPQPSAPRSQPSVPRSQPSVPRSQPTLPRSTDASQVTSRAKPPVPGGANQATSLGVGSLCMAMYSGDKVYYKAKIVEDSPEYFFVSYLDFGDSEEWVLKTNIKRA